MTDHETNERILNLRLIEDFKKFKNSLKICMDHGIQLKSYIFENYMEFLQAQTFYKYNFQTLLQSENVGGAIFKCDGLNGTIYKSKNMMSEMNTLFILKIKPDTLLRDGINFYILTIFIKEIGVNGYFEYDDNIV